MTSPRTHDGRSHDSSVLDDAFERLESSGFELPNGFINHAPMAVEALVALDRDDMVDTWARRARQGAGIEPGRPDAGFDPVGSLGDRRRLPEWIGYFERAIDADGWPAVVETWVPRLLPSLAVALFHAAIRTGHATRAIATADTRPRRSELARALGYWAARFHPGEPTTPDDPDLDGDVRAAIVAAAADGARHYLARPDILNLHGVTGAMAVELFVPHVTAATAAAGLAQVRAEHRALYRATSPVTTALVTGSTDEELAGAAAASGDPHQVKLVEACRRGTAQSGDPAFAAAAETVTGLG